MRQFFYCNFNYFRNTIYHPFLDIANDDDSNATSEPIVNPVDIFIKSFSQNSICGYGILLEKDGRVVNEASVKLGEGTSNYAELKAVYDGIRYAVNEHEERLEFLSKDCFLE